jgi:fucose permease
VLAFAQEQDVTDPCIDNSPTGLSPIDYHAIGQAIFAVGRFLAAFVCYIGVPGRLVLLVCAGGCLLTSALTMALPTGDGALTCLYLLVFFQGPIFPTLFAMTLRGMGRHTKLVSTGLTVANVGIAVWPSIAWAVGQAHVGNERYSMKILVVIYSVAFLAFATFSLHPTLRHWVDPVGRPKVDKGDEGLRRQTATE